MIRSTSASPSWAALGLALLVGSEAYGQAAADSPPPVAAETAPVDVHRLIHRRHEPACATCVAIQSTTRATKYNYTSKPRVVCYPKERCSCLRCLFHIHGHHRGCDPVVAAVVKRELVKTRVTEETPETTYEGSLSAQPAPAAGPSPCPLHGLGCRRAH